MRLPYNQSILAVSETLFISFAFYLDTRKKNIITQRMSTAIVRVCTFNIRHSYLDHATPNEWQKRRPILKQCLENMQPTIIGIQEGDPPQLKDILDDLNQ